MILYLILNIIKIEFKSFLYSHLKRFLNPTAI